MYGPERVVVAHAAISPRQTSTGAQVKKSMNWAGAMVPSNRGSSKATIKIPTPEIPADSTTPDEVHCATFWTGIDGASAQCQSILQTGIDICAQRTPNGTLDTLARSWHQFFPVPAALHDIQISFGDVVSMSVSASSPTSGVVLVENETTGKSSSQTYTNVSDATLCLETAEWVVERFTVDAATNSLVPFAGFGNATFENATVGDVGIQGMNFTMFEMITNTSTLATCEVQGSSVVCSDERQ
ncbi:hypothetical protein KVR01_011801 [Diaporthe batatas]|uniref:uncharacterized protein n=1 Tax=Diaporthe batatas TaxID=748121 RepID=UPI001D04685D|nr:uncharacterized protein KVR01_011801 [Diaporthe batatas]KAG8158679.1 hypothetical protein KVR01_011801 [Diaporthe batatas]